MLRRSLAAMILLTATHVVASPGPRPAVSDIASGAHGSASNLVPELVGPDVISTVDYDFFTSLTPDGRTMYFCKADPSLVYFTILKSTLRDDATWSEPQVASFSGRWSDADPRLSPDGTRPAHRPL